MFALREESTICRIAGFSDDHSAEMGPIYEDVPTYPIRRDERNERPNFRDFVAVLAFASALAIGVVTWNWLW